MIYFTQVIDYTYANSSTKIAAVTKNYSMDMEY